MSSKAALRDPIGNAVRERFVANPCVFTARSYIIRVHQKLQVYDARWRNRDKVIIIRFVEAQVVWYDTRLVNQVEELGSRSCNVVTNGCKSRNEIAHREKPGNSTGPFLPPSRVKP